MQEYVVVHARQIDEDGPWDRVLVVHKNRPAWQNGRLNLVGGKVEEGETPVEAAVRELKEEAGLAPLPNNSPLHCGTIFGVNSTIHCVRLDVDPIAARWLLPREEETERVEWLSFKDAWADERLMPNLRISVPLLHNGVTGWKICDQKGSSGDTHDIVVQLPIGMPFDNR